MKYLVLSIHCLHDSFWKVSSFFIFGKLGKCLRLAQFAKYAKIMDKVFLLILGLWFLLFS